MAGDKSPFENNTRSAFAEGAARFDALARDVKSRQIAESRTAPSTAYQKPVVSPDEEWGRNFMTQGIGPRQEMQRSGGFVPVPPMPIVSLDFAPTPAAAAVSRPEVPPLAAPAAIGAHLGKPRPRRSWLGRLLRPASRDIE